MTLLSPARPAAPSRPRRGWRRPATGLLLALAVYVLMRGFVLHFAFDQTVLPMYELYPMGTVPRLVQMGADLPLNMHYDNAAGQIVTGLLAVPAYAAFGPTYLALKLVPAVLGLLLVVAGWFLLRASFGAAAANVGALLLALGPAPLLAKYSLLASGNHFENLFFTALAVLAAYGYHRAARHRGAWLALSGFCAGLAIFVFLGALLPVALLLMLHVAVRGWRGSLRDARLLGPALVLGLAPLILLNLGTGGRGARFLEAKFADSGNLDPGRVVGRVREFLLVDLPRAPGFEDFAGLPAAAWATLFLAAFALAWLAAVPGALRGLIELARGLVRAERTREEELRIFERTRLMPFVLLLPLTALAYGISNFSNGGHQPPMVVAGYRYFLPSMLFANILIAVLAGGWITAGGTRRVLGLALAGAALLSGANNLSYMRPDAGRIGAGARYQGTNFFNLSRQLMVPKNQLSVPEQVRLAESLPPWERHLVFAGMGWNRAGLQWRRAHRRGRGEGDFLDIEALLEDLPRARWIDVARGAGGYLGLEAAWRRDGHVLVRANLEHLLAEGHPYARFVAEGVASPRAHPPPSSTVGPIISRLFEQVRHATHGATPHLLRGMGQAAGRLVRRGIPADLEAVSDLLANVPPSHMEGFVLGMGWGLADERDPPALGEAARGLVPAERRASLLRGYGAGLAHVYGRARAAELVAETLPPAEQGDALEGVALE